MFWDMEEVRVDSMSRELTEEWHPLTQWPKKDSRNELINNESSLLTLGGFVTPY